MNNGKPLGTGHCDLWCPIKTWSIGSIFSNIS